MCKRILLFATIFFICPTVFPQAAISNDGKYVWASVDKTKDRNGSVLVIQSTISSWKKEIKGIMYPTFTPDSKRAVFIKNDTLYILVLGTAEQKYIPGVASFKQPDSGNGEWVTYQLTDSTKKLILLNLQTNKEKQFSNVIEYSFDERGEVLLIETETRQGSISITALDWISLAKGKSAIIWNRAFSSISSYVFYSGGNQIAFMAQESGGRKLMNAIWYYKEGMEKAELLVNDTSGGIEEGLMIGKYPISFSIKGTKLFFKLKERELPQANANLVKVDVWSYTDAKVQSIQQKDLFPRNYIAVLSIADHRIVRLQLENEVILGQYYGFGGNTDKYELSEDFALTCHFSGDIVTYNCTPGFDSSIIDAYTLQEDSWNKATNCSIYLVSTKDGSRRLIKENIRPTGSNFPCFRFSPGGRFVVYFDPQRKNWFCYEISSGIICNLTKSVNTSWAIKDPEERTRDYYNPWGIVTWLENDAAVMVYDQWRDIWQLNLLGIPTPYNITNGFGRKHNIMFSIDFNNEKKFFKSGDTVILNALRNRYVEPLVNSGYYSKIIGKGGDPNKLLKFGGDYKYQSIQKASKANLYLLSKENYDSPPAYVYTSNFKNFTAITSNLPEERIPVKKELITWKTFDGRLSQGVLVKPQNFDPSIKYPVIFNYYEVESGGGTGYYTFTYYQDEIINDNFIDSGYLVFTPDIHFTIGQTGESAYNSVVSAAKYLSKRPYVDAKRMGIIGASFSGYETSYLVTHTSMFAAAWSNCGVSDFVSNIGIEDKDLQGHSNFADVEIGQHRLGVTLWERPDLYIKNSPIFYADKVATPLVLFHGRDDERVPYAQSIEFFKALRRLGKKVWLLSFEGGHGGNYTSWWQPQDLGIYKKQFFDHYLKGKPAPVWMTKGLPANKKGIVNGLEYDITMKTPGPGLLINNDEAITPQQKELLKHRTTVNNEGKIVEIKVRDKRNKKKSRQ